MKTVYTVGHSTRSLEQLVRILDAYGVKTLADVRHYPRSRHNPQFNKEDLEKELPARGIRYVWLGEELGGFRKGGYDEYAKTAEFTEGLRELEALAGEAPTAFMCAEILWFKCHRARIAQKLFERGWRVVHIYDEKKSTVHKARPVKIECDEPGCAEKKPAARAISGSSGLGGGRLTRA